MEYRSNILWSIQLSRVSSQGLPLIFRRRIFYAGYCARKFRC